MPRQERIIRPWERRKVTEGKTAYVSRDRSFYASNAWRTASERYRRENPFCVECLKADMLTDCSPGTGNGVTDHKVPISSGADPWDESNWQVLCHKHHNSKRFKERKDRQHGDD
ncbi:HNH endonuclease [Fibrisoma montanum]|uniref:HNH endonuclease n=1 Tax=Fibrisoma montanum TaxID=2305895 RepID=A0A418M3H1_9BACT|nr:HNH endonuclease signature motif containing protein [Fibrisoma montanum]RIV20308.1 HNH endonuclease [Fibrisoma montanum]